MLADSCMCVKNVRLETCHSFHSFAHCFSSTQFVIGGQLSLFESLASIILRCASARSSLRMRNSFLLLIFRIALFGTRSIKSTKLSWMVFTSSTSYFSFSSTYILASHYIFALIAWLMSIERLVYISCFITLLWIFIDPSYRIHHIIIYDVWRCIQQFTMVHAFAEQVISLEALLGTLR